MKTEVLKFHIEPAAVEGVAGGRSIGLWYAWSFEGERRRLVAFPYEAKFGMARRARLQLDNALAGRPVSWDSGSVTVADVWVLIAAARLRDEAPNMPESDRRSYLENVRAAVSPVAVLESR